MKIIDALDGENRVSDRPVVATIGVYDGIHRGHRRVIECVVKEAARRGAVSALITFDPHPRRVLAGADAPALLTSREQKLRLVSRLGIDIAAVLPFTAGLAREGAVDFITGRLLGAMDIRAICVGPRFAFGSGKSGDTALLARLGRRHGFSVRIIDAVRVGHVHVSSTAIREMLERGDLEGAARLLGRPYSFEGRVTRGKTLGRRLGSPTANLDTDGAALPPPGVYAATAVRSGALIGGILNIGVRYEVEIHLFDFDEYIYGEVLEVVPGERIRDERVFARPADLAGQIRSDIEIARRILHNKALAGAPRSARGRGAKL